ncbi:helix-turn-helix domain-containing protein [Micromonospora sp. WMMD1082]|uniref:MarR family transcriptional regulator n=1 Tax=Micromonospora sp. WMMD1082 TaxID=3016104 RepID=UPI002417DFA4|nr:helix-turn-helix domain-containing protein [Micromonospora sp. WMMD1082]MDG4798306.1 helix-turn-helix domain-containing protein [Micromonospora sp. WMMD1082]
MTDASSPELSVLHAVRVAGMASDAAVSRRTGIDQDTVSELLQDFEAYGWVTHVEFGRASGWTLTERGRDEDTRKLGEELDRAGARTAVEQAHKEFEALNGRLVRACTDWQLRPTEGDRLASNDHSDPRWDARVLDELTMIGGELTPLIGGLAGVLVRFGGYDERFDAALTRARAGEGQWVAGIDVPSCHAVWMELHEDLLSTLGIPRGAEPGTR